MKFSLVTLVVAAGVSACGDARATEAAQADLKRDLELASSTVSLADRKVDPALLTLSETKPQGAPDEAKVVKKGSGPRAVRSAAPTVRAEETEDVAAVEEIEDVTEVVAEAPAPEEITEPVAIAPRPQPVIVQTGGTGDYGTGNGGVYGGGRGGVIIRGGGVDGDNCELHRNGGRRRGPVFVPAAGMPSVPQTIIVSRPTDIGIGARSLPTRRSQPDQVSRPSPSPSRGRGISSPRIGR
jgi:hypothetical protein